ncbi:MAG TPA: glutaredoxin family protein [Planctomycetaceae bacterium]|nr:glutaredoxin family protein [Planctomycetaceae bacterium]
MSESTPDNPRPDASLPAEREMGGPERPFPGQVFLGTAAIVYATAIVFLALADDAVGLGFMPRSWYVNRMFWYFSAVLGFVAAFYLLRPARDAPAAWRPARPGVRFDRVTFYTREGCHLCEDALAILARYAAWLPAIEEIDIDTDPQLAARFGTTIPVVEIDGRVRFNGRINETLLRRLIEGTPVRRMA